MRLVPVKYSKKLSETIFASDYFTEKLNAYIDNLNTLYVAFTRAKEELIVLAPQKKTEATISIAGLLWNGLLTDQQFLFDAENGTYERPRFNEEVLLFRNGKNERSNDYEECPMERLYSLSPDKRMFLRLTYKNRIFDDEKRQYGLLMHDILSAIETREDIIQALSEKNISGEINSEDVAVLKEKLLTITAENEVSKWFDGSMQVLNETDILFGKGQSLRPDRIMIDQNNRVILVDYKFGEEKVKTHHRQIEKYALLIREMGYQHVTGYIWYVSLKLIEKCFF